MNRKYGIVFGAVAIALLMVSTATTGTIVSNIDTNAISSTSKPISTF